MKWNEFSADVHQNAVAHGWWDERRSFGEIVALCHSELSEALEEFRANRPMVWFACGGDVGGGDGICVNYLSNENITCGSRHEGCEVDKPEGIAVELADCIIRIMDWFGQEELDVRALFAQLPKTMMCDVPAPIYASSLGDRIARWHLLISLAFSCWGHIFGTHAAALRLALCVREIMYWADENGVNMESILIKKHEYNKTRPYRHGGKAL